MSFAPHMHEETPATREAARSKRTIGEDPVPVPSHSSRNIPDDFRTINGWGADLDPANRPSVPRELPSKVNTLRGDVKHWQKPHQKIYVSNEMPGITPVFGETCPPSGLSGLIRDYAFQFGEATMRHWGTLLLADRVERVERMIGDAVAGHPDNIIKEKAWGASFKYSSEDERRKYALIAGSALGAIAIALLLRRALRD